MASNYPTSLDTFTNPSAGNTLDSPSHSLQHSDINDAVEALETKLGTGDSPAGSATAGYVLVAGTADTSWNQVGYEGITSGTATAGQVLTAQGGGTALWQDIPDTGGLVHLNTTSYSAVASQSINDVFSSTYDNYRILISGTHSASGELRIRLRASGTDNTTASSYVSQILASTSTTTAGNRQTTTYFVLNNYDNTLVNTTSIDIFRPALAEATGLTSLGLRSTSGAYLNMTSGTHNQTVAYDGLTLIPETGNMTGTIRIYGYRN